MAAPDAPTHGILLVGRDGRFAAVMPFDAEDGRYDGLEGAQVGSSAVSETDRERLLTAYGEALVTGERVRCEYETAMAGGKKFRVEICRFPPTEVAAIMLASEVAPDRDSAEITAREREILKLSADDAEDATIAAELKIAKPTVSRHKQNIRAKLGVKTWPAAVAWAIRRGLI